MACGSILVDVLSELCAGPAINYVRIFLFFNFIEYILLDIHQDLPVFVLNRTWGLGVRGEW